MHDIDTGITAWMLISTALVLLMVPGLAMFYGGLVRTKNVIGTMMHSFAAMSIVTILWTICGYSMAFGENVLGGWFGWNSEYVFFAGIDNAIMSDAKIPEYVFAMFQGKFAIITPAIIAGAFAERVKFRGYCVFIALWSLFIYNPLCHWIWASDGWLSGRAIDFAGGTVIHISAGIAGLVAAFYLGARRGYPKNTMTPNNLVMTLMGAGLLWVGWFGFNAGSSVTSGLQTAQALAVTQIAAAAGAFTWMVIESIAHKKVTSLGAVSGILAGLVAITPAAGDVVPWGALVLGVFASMASYLAIEVKNRMGYDDTLDVFGIHGVSGIIGGVFLTFMLREGAGVGHIGTQLWYQVEGILVSLLYSGVMTLALLWIVEKTVGFRMNRAEENEGMDHALHGEHGYGLNNLN
jgi:Amt family ammonium transporter